MRFHALLVVSLEIFVPQEEPGEVTGLGDGRLCSIAAISMLCFSVTSICSSVTSIWSRGTGRVQDLGLNEEVPLLLCGGLLLRLGPAL